MSILVPSHVLLAVVEVLPRIRVAPAEEGSPNAPRNAVVVGRRREVDLGCTALGHERMVGNPDEVVKTLDVSYCFASIALWMSYFAPTVSWFSRSQPGVGKRTEHLRTRGTDRSGV